MIRKITHIMLAALLLFTAGGMSIHKHYCGKELKAIALYGDAEECEHAKEPQMPLCHVHGSSQNQQQDLPDDCCNNKVELEKTDVFQLSGNIQVPAVFAMIPVFTLAESKQSADRIANEYLNLIPPLIEQDLTILVQSFLC